MANEAEDPKSLLIRLLRKVTEVQQSWINNDISAHAALFQLNTEALYICFILIGNHENLKPGGNISE